MWFMTWTDVSTAGAGKATWWCGQLFGLWELHAGPLVQRIALGDERNLSCFCMALALVTGKTDSIVTLFQHGNRSFGFDIGHGVSVGIENTDRVVTLELQVPAGL